MPPVLQRCRPILHVRTFHLQTADQRAFALVHQLVNTSVSEQEDSRPDGCPHNLAERRFRWSWDRDPGVDGVNSGSGGVISDADDVDFFVTGDNEQVVNIRREGS